MKIILDSSDVYLIFLSTFFAQIVLYYGKNGYVSLVASLGMAANMIMNGLLIPKFGFIVAGYTTFLGYILICSGNALLLRRCFIREGYPLRKVLHIKKMALISSMLLIITLFCPLLYSEDIIRWSFVAVLIAVLIFNKQRFITIINQFNVNKGQTIL